MLHRTMKRVENYLPEVIMLMRQIPDIPGTDKILILPTSSIKPNPLMYADEMH